MHGVTAGLMLKCKPRFEPHATFSMLALARELDASPISGHEMRFFRIITFHSSRIILGLV